MVLANTEELHEKIERLCARVRELEHALRTLQSTVSEQTHPLLREELVKAPITGLTTSGRNDSPPQPTSSGIAHIPRVDRVGEEDSLIDAFGIANCTYVQPIPNVTLEL